MRTHFMVPGREVPSTYASFCGGYLAGGPKPTKRQLGKPVTCKRCIAKMLKRLKESVSSNSGLF